MKTNHIDIWVEQPLPRELSQAIPEFSSSVPAKVKFHQQEFCRKILRRPELIRQLAGFRLISHQQKKPVEPYPIEITQEKKILLSKKVPPFIYEANWLADFYRHLIKNSLTTATIIITNRLIATFADDGRYHLRYAYFSYPAIISLPGIEQAPARDKKYYQLKLLDPLLAKKIAGERLSSSDLFFALTNIFYQAFFYFTTSEPFCPDKNCRLYNFHWQRELKNILQKQQFCLKHQKILAGLS